MKEFSGVILVDMDEILVEISPKFYNVVRLNWLKYEPWLNDLGPLTREEILSRKQFLIEKWLMKEKFLNDVDKFKEVKHIIYAGLLQDFFKTDVYKDLEPTNFAKHILMNPVVLEKNEIKKIYILTKYPTNALEMLESKKKFIEKYFKSPKIELLPVPSGKKKSEVVKENNIAWDLFVDDEIVNIKDFVENCNIEGKEFLIPAYGYNKMPELLDFAIKEKGGAYSYYDAI